MRCFLLLLLFCLLPLVFAVTPCLAQDWNGTAGDDVMTVPGATNYDNVYGAAGNDVMTNNGIISNEMSGAEGDDTMVNNYRVGGGMIGGDGADTMTNNYRALTMEGGDGDDYMVNNDRIIGGFMHGDAGNDVLINRGEINGAMNGIEGNDRLENHGTVEHNMLGMGGNDVLINSGTVGGDILGGDGNDAISLTAGSCDSIRGGNGDDTVVFSGGNVGNIHGDLGGAVSGNNVLTLYGGVTSTGNVSDFQTVGKLGAGMVNISGALDLEGGSLSVEMHGATTQFTVGSLAGATGSLAVTMKCGGWNLGQTVDVFNVGAVGTFASESVSSGALHNFSIAGAQVTYDGRNSFTQFADSEDSLAVAGLLDGLYGAGGDMGTVFNVLDTATAAQITRALNQMGSNLNGPLGRQSLISTRLLWSALANRPGLGAGGSMSGFTLTVTGAGGQSGEVDSRAMRALAQGLSQVMRGDLDNAAGNMAAMTTNQLPQGLAESGAGSDMGPLLALTGNDSSVWMRLMTGSDHEDARDGFPGSDADHMGIAGGLDMRLDDNWQAGLHLGYTLHSLNMDDTSDSEADGWTLHAGGSVAYVDGPLSLEATADWFRTQWSTERTLFFGTIHREARAEVVTDGAALSLSGEYEVDMDGWSITPQAGVDMVHQIQQSYTEHGAGALNLSVDQVASTSLRTRLGASLSRDFEIETDTGSVTLTPELHAQWRHEFMNDATDVTCEMAGGGSFESATPDPDRDSLLLGAGLTIGRQDSPSLHLQGDTELSAHSVGYRAVLGVRIPF